MTSDIVARLRVWSKWLEERVPDSAVGDDLRAAADEIERLRAERDAARREVIRMLSDCSVDWSADCECMGQRTLCDACRADWIPLARERGWDCFDVRRHA